MACLHGTMHFFAGCAATAVRVRQQLRLVYKLFVSLDILRLAMLGCQAPDMTLEQHVKYVGCSHNMHLLLCCPLPESTGRKVASSGTSASMPMPSFWRLHHQWTTALTLPMPSPHWATGTERWHMMHRAHASATSVPWLWMMLW